MTRRCHDAISAAVLELVRAEPFLGHVLAGVNRYVGEGHTSTAAVALVGHRPVLMVNPGFFLKRLRRKGERVAVLKHEVLHLLFEHLLRTDWVRMDRRLANLAADLVVNQHIGRWPLPAGAITRQSFPELALPADGTLEQYYALLARHGASASVSGQEDFDDHGHWGQGTPSERAVADQELSRLLRRAHDRAGGWGNLPAPLRSLVDAFLQARSATLDWRRVLRLFAHSSRRTRIRSTLKRPSKRYGTYPGTRVRRRQRLVAALDTSGSIDDEDLSDFFGEIHGIWRQGAEVVVVECDAAVQRVWSYGGGGPPAVVAGRGGTAFDPVFRWMREQPRPFDACIYLTDGGAPRPQVRPPAPVLWVVSADGTTESVAFGRAVQLPRRGLGG